MAYSLESIGTSISNSYCVVYQQGMQRYKHTYYLLYHIKDRGFEVSTLKMYINVTNFEGQIDKSDYLDSN